VTDRTFILEQRAVGASVILYLDGPLRLGHREATTGFQLAETVRLAVSNGAHNVAIDLRGLVKTPDSSGLGELVAAESAVRQIGGRLVLANVPTKLRRLIEMMGLDQLFAIVDTEAEAVRLLKE
jgi:anti-sigma B factor antagonist